MSSAPSARPGSVPGSAARCGPWSQDLGQSHSPLTGWNVTFGSFPTRIRQPHCSPGPARQPTASTSGGAVIDARRP